MFANFINADIARRLGTHTQSADRQRLVTLADGSLTSSVGYVMCDVTLKHDETSMKLKDVILHILPGLTFDVIIGFPCIRKYNLFHRNFVLQIFLLKLVHFLVISKFDHLLQKFSNFLGLT